MSALHSRRSHSAYKAHACILPHKYCYDTTKDAEKEIEYRCKRAATSKELYVSQRQAAKGRVSAQKPYIDKQAARGAHEKGRIGQRRDKRQSESAGNIDKENIIGQAL